MINYKTVENYKNYGKCLSISNGVIEALVTIDLGPRIISFSFVGGKNVMQDNRDAFAPVDGEAFDKHYYKGAKWENYGGHRLWTSPESLPETYYPDCQSVDYEISGNTVVFTPPQQIENGLALSFEITMEENSNQMTVLHKGKNISDVSKEFALWALSVMTTGGVEIIPLNTKDTGLLPNRRVVLWPYSKALDNRFYLGEKYITLKQDINATCPFKLGTDCEAGVGYYSLDDVVFCKKYNHDTSAFYPDGGVSYETYTNESFLEFETLGALKTVAPDEVVTHEEIFALYQKPCDFDPRNEESIDSFIAKLI